MILYAYLYVICYMIVIFICMFVLKYGLYLLFVIFDGIQKYLFHDLVWNV